MGANHHIPKASDWKIHEAAAKVSEHTPTPWHFEELSQRPDGCGYLRCETDNLEIAHHGDMGRSREENLANAAFIVKAVNNHDALVKALTELSNMYTHAWDRVDGGLTMFGSSVDRFEKAHRDAHVLLCTIKGEPLPVDLDEDDTDLVSAPGSDANG